MKSRIHLARPGRYSDMNGRSVSLDAATIAALASSYDAAANRAPLVLGHPKTDDPAYGWVDALEVDGKGDLYAVPGDVAPALADAVRRGEYRNVSISFYPKGHANSPAPDGPCLKHVGILGATVPAIRGLEPLSFAADDGAVTVELSEKDAWAFWSMKDMARGLREWLIEKFGKDEADKVVPAYAIDDLDDAGDAALENAPAFSHPQKKPETPMATDKKAEVSFAEREADLEAREQKIAAREAEDARKDAERAETAAIAFADGLIKEGKLAPAGREIVADIHKRLATSDEPVAFADGTKAPALGEYEKLLTGAVPLICLAEVSKGDGSTVTDAKDPDALTARANKIREENPAIAFSAAVRQAEEEAAS